MDYSRSYKTATSLVGRIREAATSGNRVKAGSGLAARVATTEQKLAGYEEVMAQYMGYSSELFAPVASSKQELESYLNLPTTSPFPERNPEYWKTTPLLSPISAAETDENVRAILETIKAKESSGDYRVQNPTPGQTASGAYGYTDGTWQSLTAKYGVGTEYKSAKEAPPAVQDTISANYVREILLENNNDVTKVPVIWYTGNAQGKISQKALDINNGLTPAEYQNDWMRRYNKMLGG
jgi:muramidase (phage lysozyme)